ATSCWWTTCSSPGAPLVPPWMPSYSTAGRAPSSWPCSSIAVTVSTPSSRITSAASSPPSTASAWSWRWGKGLRCMSRSRLLRPRRLLLRIEPHLEARSNLGAGLRALSLHGLLRLVFLVDADGDGAKLRPQEHLPCLGEREPGHVRQRGVLVAQPRTVPEDDARALGQ